MHKTADNVITFSSSQRPSRKSTAYMHLSCKPIFGINALACIQIFCSLEWEECFLWWIQRPASERHPALFRGRSEETRKIIHSGHKSYREHYKRIVPGYEAPVYIAWSGANRSSMIRIPAQEDQAQRLNWEALTRHAIILSFAVFLCRSWRCSDKIGPESQPRLTSSTLAMRKERTRNRIIARKP